MIQWLFRLADVVSGRVLNSIRNHATRISQLETANVHQKKELKELKELIEMKTINEQHILDAAEGIENVATGLSSAFDAIKTKLDEVAPGATEDLTEEFAALDSATADLSSAADKLKALGQPATPAPSEPTGVNGAPQSGSGADVDLGPVGGSAPSTVPAIPLAGSAGPANPVGEDEQHESDQIQPGMQQPVTVPAQTADQPIVPVVEEHAPLTDEAQAALEANGMSNAEIKEVQQESGDGNKSNEGLAGQNTGGNTAASAELGGQQVDGGQLSNQNEADSDPFNAAFDNVSNVSDPNGNTVKE